ncbi:MAG: hypothetical protein F6J94_32025 [Moorea sp. SIO1F2]|nr:hypothetical protein [Moorena sp. SIO1F2]NET86325.1 hypothetical protein [Moorena sp. SIO1F2]
MVRYFINLCNVAKSLPVLSSLLPTPYSLLPTPCSLFPVPCSLKPGTLYLTKLKTTRHITPHELNQKNLQSISTILSLTS